MEISIKQSSQLKSIAILMMLCLHLFNRDYKGLFEPLLFIGEQPLSYYISLFCDACVPIFAFVSGYGLYYKYHQDKTVFAKENLIRIKKLYINYWIIIFIFPVIVGVLLGSDKYPGSWIRFLLNFSGIDPDYNGAWWFFTIYLLFVLTSHWWFSLLNKVRLILFLMILFVLYLLGFYFRIYNINLFTDTALDWFHKYSALYFCTLFQFMLGAFALKYKWNTFISEYIQKIKYKNWIIILLIISLIPLHTLFPNLIIAPFVGISFIFLFCQLRLNAYISKGLDFFTPHSTNMWLIHMFFYLIFFPDFIYSFRYPVLIYFILVLICVLCSFVINFINGKIQTLLK